MKDESSRLGLPAFKILGASWAVYRALEERLGDEDFGDWEAIEDLEQRLEPLRPLSLVAATDGNHGRAVARVARLLGLGARIFVPGDMVAARREAIAEESAEVVVVDGGYDEAVERSAEAEGLLISDTSWPGYERVPSWVIEGYSTMLWEIEEELIRRDERGPDLVIVQVGVGAFAAAVANHFRRPDASVASEARCRGASEGGLPVPVRLGRTARLRAWSARLHNGRPQLRQAFARSVADPIQIYGRTRGRRR